MQDAPVAKEGGPGGQGHSSAALTIGDVDLSVQLQNPLFLPLRGLSQAAARIAVHMVRLLLLPMRVSESILSRTDISTFIDESLLLPLMLVHNSGVNVLLLWWLQRMERIVQDWGKHVSVEPQEDIGLSQGITCKHATCNTPDNRHLKLHLAMGMGEEEKRGKQDTNDMHSSPLGVAMSPVQCKEHGSRRTDSSRSVAGKVCPGLDNTEARLPPDLVIVVGKGSRSMGSAVLKQLVEDMLQDRGLPCTVDLQNEGRLIVAGKELAAYVEQQRQEQDRTSYWHIAKWQYAAVGAGLSTLLSMYIVPLTLKHAI